MSEPRDDAPTDEPPPSSPFPESSLTPPPSEEAPAAPAPPSLGIPGPPPPAPPESTPIPPPPVPPVSSPIPPVPSPPSVPDPLAPAPPIPPAPPKPQPWMESPAPPAPPAFPSGYTSPPPPGAGGLGASSPSAIPAPGTHVLAGWWRRVGAAIIDFIIVGVPFLIVLSVLGLGVFAESDGSGGGLVAYVIGLFVTVLLFAVVALLYAPVMMAKTNGKTVGRMVTGIRVVRASGEPITFGFAAVREIAVKALLINGIAGAFTLGLAGLLDVLWPLWDDENRALHDFVVNTRTVMD